MITLDADLLRAVLDDPANDTLRFVCADWFEENGQPEYAEFIRVQMELYAHEDEDGWIDNFEKRSALWERESGLIGSIPLHSKQFFFPEVIPFATGTIHGGIRSIHFHRGFINSLYNITWGDWISHCDHITDVAPIEEVFLSDRPSWASNNTGILGEGWYWLSWGVWRQRMPVIWSYQDLSLDKYDNGRRIGRNFPTSEEWINHVARRLLKKEWPKINFWWTTLTAPRIRDSQTPPE